SRRGRECLPCGASRRLDRLGGPNHGLTSQMDWRGQLTRFADSGLVWKKAGLENCHLDTAWQLAKGLTPEECDAAGRLRIGESICASRESPPRMIPNPCPVSLLGF